MVGLLNPAGGIDPIPVQYLSSFLRPASDIQYWSIVHVIVVSWLSRVYGICTLSVVLCTPEGEARRSTYNYTKGTNPYTLESHDTANL